VSIASAAVAVPIAAVAAIVSRRGLTPIWPAAAALVLAVTTVKLALFSHPLAIIGDGVFQVHRAQLVAAGQFFFTSVTPRPFFEFPYGVALYVVAMPFWSWLPRELDRVWLLRVVALVADAAVGLSLFFVARRAWANPVAALYVAGLWPFARAPFHALSNANLTNAFGQSVFAVAMAGMAWTAGGGRSAWPVGLASAGILAVAFLSHFSTLTVGVLLVGLVAVVLIAAARGEERASGFVVAAILAVAIAVSYAVYYRHFEAVYQQTIERVRSEGPVDTGGSSIAASPLVKLRRWVTGGSDDYGLPGWPLGVAAAAGVFWLARERRREAFTLVLAAWGVAWVGFTAAGILTSVQMRANLAAAPVFVCLGAYALAGLHERTPLGRAVALAVAALVVLGGVQSWRICLGV
jgi:hypothetical protein